MNIKLTLFAVLHAIVLAVLPAGAADVDVYVIDTSLSIAGSAASIKQEVGDALSRASDQHRFRVYAIEGSLKLIAAGIGSADRSEALQAVAALEFRGRKTDLEAAIAGPVRALAAAGLDITFFALFTDGEHDPPRATAHRNFTAILNDPLLLPDRVPLTVRLFGDLHAQVNRPNVHFVKAPVEPPERPAVREALPVSAPGPDRSGSAVAWVAGFAALMAAVGGSYLHFRKSAPGSAPEADLEGFSIRSNRAEVHLNAGQPTCILSGGLNADLVIDQPRTYVEMQWLAGEQGVRVRNLGECEIAINGRRLGHRESYVVRSLATLVVGAESFFLFPRPPAPASRLAEARS
jgi:hypothetical protein